MKKVLIAVDGTKASTAVLSTFYNLVKKPEHVILLHVQKLQGRSLMLDMLGDAEMSTLKESVDGTEHKEALDLKAAKILNYYKGELEDSGTASVTTKIRAGHPGDEILKVASEENVDLILLGNSGRSGLNRVISGSVAREVQKQTKVPVLVAKRPSTCEEPYSWRDAFASVSVTGAIVLGLFLLGTFVGR
ncbi:MAG TPA: universal stress protein [Thermodesulfovibrionales bacterium]|nr:universal stress protein [Thermodesulfovibrionales bacterium]